jgi:hypothetical protein
MEPAAISIGLPIGPRWIRRSDAFSAPASPTQPTPGGQYYIYQISSNFAGSVNSRRNIPLTENTLVNVVDFYMSDFGNVKILPHRWISSAAPASVN